MDNDKGAPLPRRRGRPLKESAGDEAEDRARTRRAQRSFQMRKQAEVSFLEERVQLLEKTVEGMSNEFIEFGDRLLSSELSQRPQIVGELKAATQRFLDLAKIVDAETGDEKTKLAAPLSPDPGLTSLSGFAPSFAESFQYGKDIAEAFTAVTGKPARYEAADLAKFMVDFWSMLPEGKDTKIGAAHAGDDDTLMSYGQNFTAWWSIYQASGGNNGIIQRDYAILDRILPARVKSVEEWMRKVKYDGSLRPVLKEWADHGLEKK